jgi:UV DNA damage repair endonuclease
MVEIRAPMLSDANHFAVSDALRDFDEKSVASFLRQKAETNDLPG